MVTSKCLMLQLICILFVFLTRMKPRMVNECASVLAKDTFHFNIIGDYNECRVSEVERRANSFMCYAGIKISLLFRFRMCGVW